MNRHREISRIASASKKPRILFVLRSLDVGGAEKQIFLLIKNIHQTTHACNVFTLEKVGILNQQLSKLNVPVYSGGLKKGDILQSPGKVIFAALRLLVCIRSVRPKIIHSCLPLVTFLGAMLGRIFKVSLVVTSLRALTSHQPCCDGKFNGRHERRIKAGIHRPH